jgi:hypothetical protein
MIPSADIENRPPLCNTYSLHLVARRGLGPSRSERHSNNSGRGAAWIACLLGVQEVGGSNPPAPTLFLARALLLPCRRAYLLQFLNSGIFSRLLSASRPAKSCRLGQGILRSTLQLLAAVARLAVQTVIAAPLSGRALSAQSGWKITSYAPRAAGTEINNVRGKVGYDA